MELFIAVSQQTFVWILKINALHFKIGASKKSIVFFICTHSGRSNIQFGTSVSPKHINP